MPSLELGSAPRLAPVGGSLPSSSSPRIAAVSVPANAPSLAPVSQPQPTRLSKPREAQSYARRSVPNEVVIRQGQPSYPSGAVSQPISGGNGSLTAQSYLSPSMPQTQVPGMVGQINGVPPMQQPMNVPGMTAVPGSSGVMPVINPNPMGSPMAPASGVMSVINPNQMLNPMGAASGVMPVINPNQMPGMMQGQMGGMGPAGYGYPGNMNAQPHHTQINPCYPAQMGGYPGTQSYMPESSHEEAIVPPTPRRYGGTPQSGSMGVPSGYGSSQSLGRVSRPAQYPHAHRGLSNDLDIDPESVISRPRDTMTGRATDRSDGGRGQISGETRQTVFMKYAQPLISKFGPGKVVDALHMAQGIWNASVLGGLALAELYASAEGSAAFKTVVDAMLTRKAKFFADELWRIDNMQIKIDDDGDLEFHFDAFE